MRRSVSFGSGLAAPNGRGIRFLSRLHDNEEPLRFDGVQRNRKQTSASGVVDIGGENGPGGEWHGDISLSQNAELSIGDAANCGYDKVRQVQKRRIDQLRWGRRERDDANCTIDGKIVGIPAEARVERRES